MALFRNVALVCLIVIFVTAVNDSFITCPREKNSKQNTERINISRDRLAFKSYFACRQNIGVLTEIIREYIDEIVGGVIEYESESDSDSFFSDSERETPSEGSTCASDGEISPMVFDMDDVVDWDDRVEEKIEKRRKVKRLFNSSDFLESPQTACLRQLAEHLYDMSKEYNMTQEFFEVFYENGIDIRKGKNIFINPKVKKNNYSYADTCNAKYDGAKEPERSILKKRQVNMNGDQTVSLHFLEDVTQWMLSDKRVSQDMRNYALIIAEDILDDLNMVKKGSFVELITLSGYNSDQLILQSIALEEIIRSRSSIVTIVKVFRQIYPELEKLLNNVNPQNKILIEKIKRFQNKIYNNILLIQSKQVESSGILNSLTGENVGSLKIIEEYIEWERPELVVNYEEVLSYAVNRVFTAQLPERWSGPGNNIKFKTVLSYLELRDLIMDQFSIIKDKISKRREKYQSMYEEKNHTLPQERIITIRELIDANKSAITYNESVLLLFSMLEGLAGHYFPVPDPEKEIMACFGMNYESLVHAS
ncbi:MAG: hypothetical protein ABH857_04305 [Elusimicrobiota bacterium]